jgi:hypothetical protein
MKKSSMKKLAFCDTGWGMAKKEGDSGRLTAVAVSLYRFIILICRKISHQA